METKKENFSFEEAYARLEKILEFLNSGQAPLEKSLSLYEEANHLITLCNKKLSHAEQKIQTLITNSSGDLALTPEGSPQTRDFE